MIDRLKDNGRITDYLLPFQSYTHFSSQWLFIASTALSFQFHEERHNEFIDNDLFGGEFGLNDILVLKLKDVVEREWYFMEPEMTQVNVLKDCLNDIKSAWYCSPNDFEKLMHYISKLAKKVFLHIAQIEGQDNIHFQQDTVKHFDDTVICPLIDAFVSEAFSILNFSNYGYEQENQMDTWDVIVLYSVFDIYQYSITVSGNDPKKFEKSLRYRASFDDHLFNCLLEFKDIQWKLNPPCYGQWDNYAIDQMLEQMSPSIVAGILKNVFPHQDTESGETFLHVIARTRVLCFDDLFPFCPEFHSIRDGNGLTPMALAFSEDLHLSSEWFSDEEPCPFYKIVSNNSAYFAALI